jgi:fluoride exporter
MAPHSDRGDSHPEPPIDPDPGPLTLGFVALVGIGGLLGTLGRYEVGRWLPAGAGLPRGTLLANLVGALILGVLLESLAIRGDDTGRRRQTRLLVGTGFCGGLTTYSTLAVETDLLVRAHRAGLAAEYAIGSVIAGVAVAAIGIALASWIRRAAT